MLQPIVLWQSKHQIHILDSLTTGALDNIINHTDDNDAARNPVLNDADDAMITSPHMPRLRRRSALRQDVHKRLILILSDQLVAHRVGAGAAGTLYVDRLQDASRHGHEMGREGDYRRGAARFGQALLDLGRVAVRSDAVRADAVGDFAEEGAYFRGAPGASRARLRVDDNVLARN